jgi:hypothetical protein
MLEVSLLALQKQLAERDLQVSELLETQIGLVEKNNQLEILLKARRSRLHDIEEDLKSKDRNISMLETELFECKDKMVNAANALTDCESVIEQMRHENVQANIIISENEKLKSENYRLHEQLSEIHRFHGNNASYTPHANKVESSESSDDSLTEILRQSGIGSLSKRQKRKSPKAKVLSSTPIPAVSPRKNVVTTQTSRPYLEILGFRIVHIDQILRRNQSVQSSAQEPHSNKPKMVSTAISTIPTYLSVYSWTSEVAKPRKENRTIHSQSEFVIHKFGSSQTSDEKSHVNECSVQTMLEETYSIGVQAIEEPEDDKDDNSEVFTGPVLSTEITDGVVLDDGAYRELKKHALEVSAYTDRLLEKQQTLEADYIKKCEELEIFQEESHSNKILIDELIEKEASRSLMNESRSTQTANKIKQTSRSTDCLDSHKLFDAEIQVNPKSKSVSIQSDSLFGHLGRSVDDFSRLSIDSFASSKILKMSSIAKISVEKKKQPTAASQTDEQGEDLDQLKQRMISAQTNNAVKIKGLESTHKLEIMRIGKVHEEEIARIQARHEDEWKLEKTKIERRFQMKSTDKRVEQVLGFLLQVKEGKFKVSQSAGEEPVLKAVVEAVFNSRILGFNIAANRLRPKLLKLKTLLGWRSCLEFLKSETDNTEDEQLKTFIEENEEAEVVLTTPLKRSNSEIPRKLPNAKFLLAKQNASFTQWLNAELKALIY